MTHSLFGEIEVNVRILEVLFKKLDPLFHSNFAEALMGDKEIDLSQLLVSLQLGKVITTMIHFL
jgi:hypothetical protein